MPQAYHKNKESSIDGFPRGLYNSGMQIANFFSMNRIVLAPVFFIIYFFPAFFEGASVPSVCVLVPLFIYMELTDFLDGYFARKLGIVSDFGKLFDPFADVLANLTVFFTFVLSGYMPAFFFLIVLFREMAMLFVRMLCIRNGVVIAARMAGKVKTVVYITAGGFSLFIECLLRLNSAFGGGEAFLGAVGALRAANLALYALAAILSVSSFISYVRAFRSTLMQEERQPL